MPLTFTVNGRVVDADQFEAMATKKKPRAVSLQSSYHKGFRVVGHKAGAMEEARQQSEHDHAGYLRLTPAERLQRGMKQPKPWDEESWRRNSKKDSVRSKPYEILEAAEQCAEMARKAGWEDVEIIEVKRVVNDQGGQGAIA